MKIQFENQFVQSLPADKITEVFPRQVEDACFSFVEPTVTNNPALIAISEDVAFDLNLAIEDFEFKPLIGLLTGNYLSPEMKPYSMCYGGHQFGQWAGQLGDGRAINLGELKDRNGFRQTLQLKGAGMTPYSRTADGLAVLRSSVREFLCSEAMYYLGIPTTRALSLGLTGEQVLRDMFYDGNSGYEQGAVVCRVSPSFIRFGNFEIHAARKENEILKRLADYTISNYFPHLKAYGPDIYEQWFDEVCHSTMDLMVDWMRVGFVHGVMNTDNMSILSQTIDYGPYGWLEGFDLNWTPNTTDAQGKRYCYGNQPQVARWNLFQLANALVPLIGRVEGLEKSLEESYQSYQKNYQNMMAAKLGLKQLKEKEDQVLIEELIQVLSLSEIDMTIFFRCLADLELSVSYSDNRLIGVIKKAYYDISALNDENSHYYVEMLAWLRKYLTRLDEQKLSCASRKEKMNRVNPKYVLRNYLVQIAIDKADLGDYSEIKRLLELMKQPYDEQPQFESYAQKRPEWARNKAGCSMLSCSS